MSSRSSYLSERLAVREDATQRFSSDWHDPQVQYFLGIHPIQSQVRSDLLDRIEPELVAHPHFDIFLKTLLRHPDRNEILDEHFSLSVDERKTILECLLSKNTLNINGLPPKLSAFASEFPSRRHQMVALNPTGNRSQIEGPVMHWTFIRRQADSNLLLSRKMLERCSPERSYRALFVGGSLGITSTEFLHSIDETLRDSWHVMSADLFPPEQIFQRLKSEAPPESPYATMERFPKLSSIEYLCMDMQDPCFKENSLDMVDACNVLGYITSVNARLNIVQRLWSLLKIGGWMRLVTPSYESLFEQLVVEKTSATSFDVLFVNLTGKTVPKGMGAEDRHQQGLLLTQMVQKIRAFESPPEDMSLDAEEKAVFDDIQRLSPIRFGAGVYDDYRILPGKMKLSYDDYAKDMRRIVSQIATKIS